MSSTASKLASGSVLRVLNFVAQVLVAFFLMPFVVHSLGDRLYGFWTVVGTFIGYYGLLDLGLSNAINRYIARAIGAGDRDEWNRIYNTGLLLFLAIGFVAFLITIIVAGLSPLLLDSSHDLALFQKVVLILGVSIAIELPIRVFVGVLYAQLRFDIVSAVQMMSLALRTILIVWALSSGYKVLALAWVTFLSGIPTNALYVYFAKKTLPSLRFDSKYRKSATAKRLFSYSFFIFIARIADQLKFHADAFVITGFLCLSAVTHYRIASMLVGYFNELIGAVMGVFTSLFSQQDGAKNDEDIVKTFFFATKISICISSFVTFGFIAWGKPFIQRWMGPGYLDAYPCLVILVLGFVFALWQAPTVSLLYGTSKHKYLALFNSIEGGCNLLFSIMLVRNFGLIGVALGTSIPMVINKLIFQPLYLCRVSSIRYGEYVRKVLSTIGMTCLSLVIPALISLKFVTPEYHVLFMLACVSLCLYLFPMWVFGLNRREQQVLHALVSKLRFRRAAISR